MAIFNHVVRFPASAQVNTKIKKLGNEKLIPKSERKDKIKLYKCLKNKKVISGRPEMTENKSPSENIFSGAGGRGGGAGARGAASS